MEGLIVLAGLLCVGSTAIAIVAAKQCSDLRAAVDAIKKRLTDLEQRPVSPFPDPAPLERKTPPPLPDFLKPPPIAPEPVQSPPAIANAPPAPTFNWESILGVKLFAWIGGLALFLGVIFFVKYAFENNWITPAMRIIAGAALGLALVGVSLLPALRRYRIPAQSLCATGILILYAAVYTAYSFYALIPLTTATFLMWIVTFGSLALAANLTAQSVAWLSVVGGFLTPFLVKTAYDSRVALFGYVFVLNCGIAAAAGIKKWGYLILLAAIGSALIEFTWAADMFGGRYPRDWAIFFLAIEAEFLGIAILLRAKELGWTISATAVTGFATLIFCLGNSDKASFGWQHMFPLFVLGVTGLIALASFARFSDNAVKGLAAIVLGALAMTCFVEWAVHVDILRGGDPLRGIGWHVVLFLLFASLPYFCGTDRVWPWIISALTGPLQFWFVYHIVLLRFPTNYIGLLPLAFALPAIGGVAYLVTKKNIPLVSADTRLAVQAAAVLAFVSLVFPVQFEREWITIGWAIEGFGLMLLFRWIPNRRLRAVAIIVLSGAFVRLALNPAVLEYHPRAQTAILNWYLYAYGLAALCFFLSAWWFGEPIERQSERVAKPLLYSFAGITLFLLMNIEIADYFSIGPTLTFSFTGDFARDMAYTIAWALFAFGLLILGLAWNRRSARLVAIALLCVAFGKLFLHDLNNLNQLYRIGAFISLAIIAIVASFLYQRFLSPEIQKS